MRKYFHCDYEPFQKHDSIYLLYKTWQKSPSILELTSLILDNPVFIYNSHLQYTHRHILVLKNINMGLFKLVIDSMLHPNRPIDFSPEGGGFGGTPWRGGRGRGGRGGGGRGRGGGGAVQAHYNIYEQRWQSPYPPVEPILGPHHAHTVAGSLYGVEFGPYEKIYMEHRRGRVRELPYSMRNGPMPDGSPWVSFSIGAVGCC